MCIRDRLRDITYHFARGLKYTGFLEMEYKIDALTGEPYLLDVNPRPWGWISILGTVYPDLYEVLRGNKPSWEKQNAVWQSPIRAFFSKKNPQNVGMPAGIGAYRKAYDIKDKADCMPSFMIYGMAFKKIVRRIK